MTDVRQQLTEALDRAEAIARAATPGPWRYNPDKMWNLPGLHFGEEFVGAGALDKAICVAATGEADDQQSMRDAAFIARWDPATVLRLVERDREMLDEHRDDRPDWRCACTGSPALPCRELRRATAFWLGTPEVDHG